MTLSINSICRPKIAFQQSTSPKQALNLALKHQVACDTVSFGKHHHPSEKIGPVHVKNPHEIEKAAYKERLHAAQAKLEKLQELVKAENKEVILVFEGWDAAGKGGAIKRLVKPLDSANYSIYPTGAPTPEEKAEPFLKRFERKLEDAHGKISIFDRSWYGRVLVERIEGFAKEKEWKKGYEEINDFEKDLMKKEDALILKFFIDVSKDEQMNRFIERLNTPEKRCKITGEDLRNRQKWDEYKDAYNDMFDKTSPKEAPWHIIPGDCKRHARLEVLETVVKALEESLDSFDKKTTYQQ